VPNWCRIGARIAPTGGLPVWRSVVLDARATPWGGGASVLLALQLPRYPKGSLSFSHVGNAGSTPAGIIQVKSLESWPGSTSCRRR